jgi:hypothetical protein
MKKKLVKRGVFAKASGWFFKGLVIPLTASLSPLEGEGAIKNPNVQWMGS